MQIYYDPQTFLRQRTGGISRLFTDLVATFDRDTRYDVSPILPFRWSNNQHAYGDLAHREMRITPPWLPRGVAYLPWIAKPQRATGPVDLVHHTYFGGRFLNVRRGTPKATTVYDMIPELFEGSGIHTGSHLQKRRYVQMSELVICISDSTRSDLEQLFGTPPGLVRVVPLGVRPGFGPMHATLPGAPSNYLLYVGARRGYKDFCLLPEALAQLRTRGIDIPLLIAGEPLAADEVQLVRRYGLTKRVHQMRLDDSELKQAYAHCAALVQTSSYEGFGLPPLEAMASGAPAVVARASSMPEVGGLAARYFEPGSAESLAEAIEVVLSDSALNKEMRRLGLERARLLTMERTARLTADAYRDVLSA